MGRTRHDAIEHRTPSLARRYAERVLAALRDVAPQTTFVDGYEGAAPAKGAAAGRKRGIIRVDATGAAEAGRRRFESRRWPGTMIQRLIRDEIDLAIMDARWIPLELPSPVEIAAILERTNPFDALISCEDLILDEQPENTAIAASDPVKRGQLLYYRPDLKLVDANDDFDDLFTSVKRGSIGGFVFPASDIEALNQQENVVEVFTTSICTPVPGQGALALLGRKDAKEVFAVARHLNDASTAAEVELERLFLEFVTKDGRGPVGALGNVEGISFEIEAAIAAPDGSEKIVGGASGQLADRAKIVEKLAGELVQSGGGEIIASFRKARGNG